MLPTATLALLLAFAAVAQTPPAESPAASPAAPSSPSPATSPAAPSSPSPAAPSSSSSATAASDGRCSMAVLDFSPKGVSADGAKVFVDTLALALEEGSQCRVLSAADMRSMVEFESLRETLGCDDAAAACLAELGGALGVGHVITGELVDLGDGSVAITARKVAIVAGQVDGRANITAPSDLASLREAGPRAATVLLGRPDPGVPVEVEASPLPMISTGVGGAVAVVGGVLIAMGETTLSTPTAKSADKNTGLLLSRVGAVAVAGGVVVAGVGAVMWMVQE